MLLRLLDVLGELFVLAFLLWGLVGGTLSCKNSVSLY